MTFTRWLEIGWAIWLADFLYFLTPFAYRGEAHPPSDWHATLNTYLFFGGWILFALLLLFSLIGSFIAWNAKQREL